MHRHLKCTIKDTLAASRRCMTPLFQTFNLKSNDAATPSALANKYIPIKRFYHNSLIHTLKTFMRRKLFVEMLEETFARNIRLDSESLRIILQMFNMDLCTVSLPCKKTIHQFRSQSRAHSTCCCCSTWTGLVLLN